MQITQEIENDMKKPKGVTVAEIVDKYGVTYSDAFNILETIILNCPVAMPTGKRDGVRIWKIEGD